MIYCTPPHILQQIQMRDGNGIKYMYMYSIYYSWFLFQLYSVTHLTNNSPIQ